MIPRRMRSYAAPSRRIIECENCVGRAARFKRTAFLKIFAFKKQRGPPRLIQPRACQHRRATNVRTNPLMRGADVIKIERHNSQIYNPSSLADYDLFRNSSFEFRV